MSAYECSPLLGQPSKLPAHAGELGDISAVIAHELRSPLAGIAATAQALRDSLAEGAEGRGSGVGGETQEGDPAPALVPPAGGWWRESVEVILEEVRRLEGVVHHLLEFARTRRPRLAVHELAPSLARLLRSVAAAAAAAGVAVRVEVPDERTPVLADPELLAQVLLNLATNAIQAMPRGGSLTVRTRVADADSAFVCVEFADTGGGIAPEDLPRVFEPFFTRREGGLGLGLATATCLAEAQGGYLTVESSLGVGSCFTVYLRRASAQEGE